MFGRSGRPLFDDEGEGIVITSSHMMMKYLSFLNE
jgi:replicative superfamily II helicase